MSYQISITGTVSITVFTQENSLYLCQISSNLGENSQTTQVFLVQTPEHLIAKH